MSDERQHAEAVARAFPSYGQRRVREAKLADVIERERAGLLARAEAAERILTEVQGYRAEENAAHGRDLDEVADLRAKLAAAEARVAELDGHVTRHYAVLEAVRRELGDGWMATDDLAERVKLTREAKDHWLKMVRERASERDEAIAARDAAMTFAAGDNERADEYMAKWQAAIARAERAEAAAGQMRAALVEVRARLVPVGDLGFDAEMRVTQAAAVCDTMLAALASPPHTCREGDLKGTRIGKEWCRGCKDPALATDVGRGYLSPEQVARACAAARDAALEEACKAQCPRCASGDAPSIIPGHVYHRNRGTGGGGWPESTETCKAAGIRALKVTK